MDTFSLIGPEPLGIRPTMDKSCSHVAQGLLALLGRSSLFKETRYTAHYLNLAALSVNILAKRALVACTEYSFSTKPRPFLPIFMASSGSFRRVSNAFTHSFLFPARNPFTPCCTILVLTPTGDAITGLPQAIYWINL